MPSHALESDAPSASLGASHRGALALLVGVTTLALLAATWQRRPDVATLLQLLPAADPAVQLDRDITAEFGMQNPIVWVIAARHGTIWNREALAHVHDLTQEAFTLPGVVATDVLSIASPNLRDVELTDDSMRPTYVMSEVPQNDAELAALRRRVESNPNYDGVFVSRDGRAAMIVADFAADADERSGAAALALRDRHRDADTEVYVSGKPVIAAGIMTPALRLGAMALLVLIVGASVLSLAHGARFLLSAALAAGLSVAWALTLLVLLNAIVLPWTALALLPAMLLAVVFTAVPAAAWRTLSAVAGGVLLGFLALALIVAPPARAFGAAMAVSVLAALLAAAATQLLVGEPSRQLVSRRPQSLAALLLIIAVLPGLIWLRSSLASVGYARRYLPPAAASDLQGISEHFPPPVTLAVRITGEPGLVQSAALLTTIDAATTAVRSDPVVVRAMSVADIVKLMHRVFNDNRPEFFAIPDDGGAVARYLTLGYSPGFRTFVDRAFSRTAVWAYLSSESPGDVARVRSKMAAPLAQRLPSAATVDVAGGEGALILVAASMLSRLAFASAVALLVACLIILITAGPWIAVRAFVGAALTTAVASGAMGWLGVPIDLISFPFLIAAAAVGCVRGALASGASSGCHAGLSLALVVMAAPCLLVSYPAARLVGSTFLAMALTGFPWTFRHRAGALQDELWMPKV